MRSYVIVLAEPLVDYDLRLFNGGDTNLPLAWPDGAEPDTRR